MNPIKTLDELMFPGRQTVPSPLVTLVVFNSCYKSVIRHE